MQRTYSRIDKTVWWINPFKLLIFFIIPIYTVVFWIPFLSPNDLNLVKYKVFLNFDFYLLGFMYLAVATFACFAAIKVDLVRTRCDALTSLPAWNIRRIYLDIIAVCTIVAYIIWFHGFALHPRLLLNVLTGAGGASAVRHELSTIPGVTTMSQFGVAYVIFYLNQFWYLKTPFTHKRYKWYFILILGLTFLRVIAWSERLAIIELALPISVIFFSYRSDVKHRFVRIIKVLGPYCGIVFLFLFFGILEFFRSWSSHYSSEGLSFWAFIGSRLLAYYFTALNNGAGLLSVYSWPTYNLESVFLWLYKFPLIGPVVEKVVIPDGPLSGYLDDYADPEFNNLSGIFTVFYDLGIVGGFLYAILWGGLLGYLYKTFTKSSGIGVVLYPAMLISVLEVMRIVYVAESRAFPVFMIITIGYWFWRCKRTPTRVLKQPN